MSQKVDGPPIAKTWKAIQTQVQSLAKRAQDARSMETLKSRK